MFNGRIDNFVNLVSDFMFGVIGEMSVEEV